VDDLVPAPVEHLAQVVGLHREGAGCEFKARLSVWKPEYEDPHWVFRHTMSVKGVPAPAYCEAVGSIIVAVHVAY
jgi:hypothetical protein